MDPRPANARKRIYLFSAALYLVLWLAELASKLLAVRLEYASDVVQSSLMAKIGEAVRLFGLDAALYVLTLVLIYLMFAGLNGHYAFLLAERLGRLRPGLGRNAPGLALLAVHGTFLVAVYMMNAALYPASDLAIGAGGGLESPGTAPVLKTAALILLGLFLLGFFILNARYARRAARTVSFVLWIGLLIAPLDPAYLAGRLWPRKAAARTPGRTSS